jgi:hypothetical protein
VNQRNDGGIGHDQSPFVERQDISQNTKIHLLDSAKQVVATKRTAEVIQSHMQPDASPAPQVSN